MKIVIFSLNSRTRPKVALSLSNKYIGIEKRKFAAKIIRYSLFFILYYLILLYAVQTVIAVLLYLNDTDNKK